MDIVVVEKFLAFFGALVVAGSALTSLRGEWKKTGLDDHVSKVMLALLTLGCVIVVLVAVGLAGTGRG